MWLWNVFGLSVVRVIRSEHVVTENIDCSLPFLLLSSLALLPLPCDAGGDDVLLILTSGMAPGGAQCNRCC